MFDLTSFVLGLFSTFAGVDVAGQLAASQDSFGYSILLWLLNLAGVI